MTLNLPGRGRTLIHDVAGPESAPALLVLHGLTLTTGLNWGSFFPALAGRFRVVGQDLRGHGGGIRPEGGFSLEDCADDAAALIGTLRLGSVTAVGFSMGGLVAQLLWRRRPDLVSGLVLCSTFARIPGLRPAPLLGAWYWPSLVWPDLLGMSLIGPIDDPALRRRAAAEMRRADPAAVISAAWATARFSSESWIGEVDVPTAVLMTTLDDVVPYRWQRALAEALPQPAVYELEGSHGALITQPHRFGPVLVEACSAVTSAVSSATRLPADDPAA